MQDKIEKLKNRLREYFKLDKSGHDFGHLIRVMKIATYLQNKEGGDLEVIAISALVHDVHRIMQTKIDKFVPPKDSLGEVSNLIRDLGLSKEKIEHILYAVEHHEEYGFGKEKVTVTDIESQILQDADNLDLVGAIGIGRNFQYDIAYGIINYDETIPLYQNEFSEIQQDASTIHHMYNKVMRLGEFMNTKTARKLAKTRTKFLDKFIGQYISEWNGEFEE